MFHELFALAERLVRSPTAWRDVRRPIFVEKLTLIAGDANNTDDDRMGAARLVQALEDVRPPARPLGCSTINQ